MSWHPADNRYEAMILQPLRPVRPLPAISLGLWHNFGDDTPHKAKQRDLPQGLRPRHHPLRPRQQLRPAVRHAPKPPSARSCAADFAACRDEMIISTKAGYDDVAGPLWRVGQPQVPARQPRPEPEAHGPRLCRHLLLAPLRPRDAARGDDGRAGPRGAAPGKALYVGISSYNSRAHARGGRHPARARHAAADPPAQLFDDQPLGRGGRPARHAGRSWASARSSSRRSPRAC